MVVVEVVGLHDVLVEGVVVFGVDFGVCGEYKDLVRGLREEVLDEVFTVCLVEAAKRCVDDKGQWASGYLGKRSEECGGEDLSFTC